MKHINYTSLRNNLASVIDQVNENHVPILITRRNAKPAVIVSLEDFNSYNETSYLVASPKNKARLDKAIRNVEQGNYTKHDLIEE
jgi:antitoxin YefM